MTPTAKPQTLPGGLRTHGCRLSTDWSYQGTPALILENELLRITLLTGHGAHISEFRYKPLDLDVLYHDPSGLLPDQRDPAHHVRLIVPAQGEQHDAKEDWRPDRQTQQTHLVLPLIWRATRNTS